MGSRHRSPGVRHPASVCRLCNLWSSSFQLAPCPRQLENIMSLRSDFLRQSALPHSCVKRLHHTIANLGALCHQRFFSETCLEPELQGVMSAARDVGFSLVQPRGSFGSGRDLTWALVTLRALVVFGVLRGFVLLSLAESRFLSGLSSYFAIWSGAARRHITSPLARRNGRVG